MQAGMAATVALLFALTTWTRGGQAAPPPPPGAAPAGLLLKDTPQFLLLSLDDGVKAESAGMLRQLTQGRRAANGCPLAATLFAYTKKGNYDCKELKALWKAGYEVAGHGVNHKRLTGAPRRYVQSEVGDNRKQLAACGLPRGDVQGFRAPYLDVDRQLRGVLSANRFLYDASLLAPAPASFGARLWPWDMGGGIPFQCSSVSSDFGTHNQTCEPGERWEGVWQVPMWRLTAQGPSGPYTMDPGFTYAGMQQVQSSFDILRANFDEAYAGNRAPMPLYVHGFFLKHGSNLADVERFIEYALSKPDVVFVTFRQLIAWLQHPVPSSQLTPKLLGCGNPGGRPGTLAKKRRGRRRS